MLRQGEGEHRPDSVFPEHATQYPGTQGARQARITIGFDWGTSCTKVVLRDAYGLNSPSYLVDFGDLGDPERSFLLPSRVYMDEGGQASLCAGTSGVAVSDIKLLLIDEDRPAITEGPLGELGAYRHEVAALYVAAALRCVRGWFLREHEGIYRQNAIGWELNVGIPASSLDDTVMCGVFREVARVGWWLSVQEGPLLLETAREGFRRTAGADFDAGLDDHAFNVVPEVAAQVVGYARSNYRNPGLHVLVDVGAATLDVAGFILHEDEGDDSYKILRAGVIPVGSFRLHEQRVRTVTGSVAEWDGERSWTAWCDELTASCTPMCDVPSSMEGYYPEPVRANVSVPKDPDGTFKGTTTRTLHEVLHDIRKFRDPGSPAWSTGLPVFVCGGGQDVAPYKNGVASVCRWWRDFTEAAPFQLLPLPKPSNLHAPTLAKRDFHRISVAYGLSHPADDIGEIRPPSAIRDYRLPPPSPRSSFRYVDTKDWT